VGFLLGFNGNDLLLFVRGGFMVRRRSSNAFYFLFGVALLFLISVIYQIQALVPNAGTVLSGVSLVLLVGISSLGFYTGFRLRDADLVKVLISVFVLVFSLQVFAGQFAISSQTFLSSLLPAEATKYAFIPFALVVDFLRYAVYFVAPMGIVPAFNKLKELAH